MKYKLNLRTPDSVLGIKFKRSYRKWKGVIPSHTHPRLVALLSLSICLTLSAVFKMIDPMLLHASMGGGGGGGVYSIQIMHIREIVSHVSKNYSPRGNFIQV